MKQFHSFIILTLFCSSLSISASFYNQRREDPRYRTIFVQTANNKKIPCNADQNIAVFFEQCRHQSDCKGEKLTLIFDNFEIKEGTDAANKRFNEYKTNTKEAFVQELHDNRLAQTSASSTSENNDFYLQHYLTGIVAAVTLFAFSIYHS